MNIVSKFKTNRVMKQGVDLSTGSFWFSLFVTLALFGLAWYNYFVGNIVNTWIFGGAVFLLCLLMLRYMPMSITIEDDSLVVNRSYWYKRLSLPEIESIELMQPTMGAKAILASRGFWGYWGWYSEADLGKYFAMYGKASDCFFVRMKDGRQYMLGCKNPETVVDYVKSHLS